MVEFARSALVAQGFACLDPGRGHGTAGQAMLRAASHMPQLEGPTTRIYNCVLGSFGEKKKKKKKKKRLATVASPGANLKEKSFL